MTQDAEQPAPESGGLPPDGITDEEFRELIREGGTPAERLMINRIVRQRKQINSLEAELAAVKAERDEAYNERNQLVAFLARLYPSGIKRTAIEGWDEAWHNCVYVNSPAGQLSWHYHDREAAMFADLPPYTGEWDGHSTPEKYSRIASMIDPAGDFIGSVIAIRCRKHYDRPPLNATESNGAECAACVAEVAEANAQRWRELATDAMHALAGGSAHSTRELQRRYDALKEEQA